MKEVKNKLFKPLSNKSAQFVNFLKNYQRIRDSSVVSYSLDLCYVRKQMSPQSRALITSIRCSLIVEVKENQQASLVIQCLLQIKGI